MATKSEILNVLTLLAAAYGMDRPGKELTEDQVKVYLRTLDDLDAGRLEEAAYLWIRTGRQYFPRVVELREFAGQVVRNEHSEPPDPVQRFWLAMSAFGATLRGGDGAASLSDTPEHMDVPLPEAILDERLYTPYFHAPKSFEELDPEAQTWWNDLPAPAASDIELEKRYPLPEGVTDEADQAIGIAQYLIGELHHGCERIEIAGGMRRQKPDVHDLELVAIPKVVTVEDLFGNPTNSYSLLDVELQRLNFLRISGGEKQKKYMLPQGIILDLFITSREQWGWIFTLRTGHADFSHWLVTPRRTGGARPAYITARDGWLWSGGNQIKVLEEQDAFRVLGVEWIEPEFRSIEHRERWRLL